MQNSNADVYTNIWTYEEYMQLPEDGNKYELIEGELVVTPAPFFMHQNIIGRLFKQLFDYAEKTGGVTVPSPVDVKLASNLVVQPDIVYISSKNKDIIKDRIYGTPDLVVEVLSESTALYDRRRKKDIYEKYGINEYLLASPEDQTVDHFRLEGAHYVFMGKFTDAVTVLDGLEINIKTLFK